jgi:hypothetical protein
MFRRNWVVLAGWGQWSHRYGDKSAFQQEDQRQGGHPDGEGGPDGAGGAGANNGSEHDTSDQDPGSEWETNEELEPEYMKLMEAYDVFGYKLGDKIEAGDLRKRFKKLALKAHPDQGGSEESFRTLIEAQKLMLSARHDKATRTKSGKKKADPPKHTYTRSYHYEAVYIREVENLTEQVIGKYVDVFIVLVSLGFIWYWVGQDMKEKILLLNQTRGRLDRTEMHPDPEVILHDKGQWHAWRANNQDISRLQQIENWATPELTFKEREQRIRDGTLKEAPSPGTPGALRLVEQQKEARAEALWQAANPKGSSPLAAVSPMA